MTGNSEQILKAIFGTDKLNEVSLGELRNLVESHPVFNAGHYLLSKKLQAENTESFLVETQRTALHFHNPLWLQWLLENDVRETVAEAAVEEPIPTAREPYQFEDSIDQPETHTAESFWHRTGESGYENLPTLQEPYRPEPDEMESKNDQAIGEFAETHQTNEDEHPISYSQSSDADWLDKPLIQSEEESIPENTHAEIAATYDSQSFHEAMPEETTPAEKLNGQEAPKDLAHFATWKEELPAESTITSELNSAEEYHTPDLISQTAEPEEPEAIPVTIDDAIWHTDHSLTKDDRELPETSAEEMQTETEPRKTDDTGLSEISPLAASITESTTTGQEILQPESHSIETIHPERPKTEEKPELDPDKHIPDQKALIFEPYHTIDYFASQGIRLQLEENPTDKFGKQLKSFTDWLKVMKRLPQKPKETVIEEEDDSNNIQQIAEHSIEEQDTITEAMAEVLARQGKTDRAIYVYSKLSLLDPSKSAYFAAKIDQLKTT